MNNGNKIIINIIERIISIHLLKNGPEKDEFMDAIFKGISLIVSLKLISKYFKKDELVFRKYGETK